MEAASLRQGLKQFCKRMRSFPSHPHLLPAHATKSARTSEERSHLCLP